MLLINEIRRLAAPAPNLIHKKHWLKNAEVRKLLNLSSNTIQRLSVTGKLRSGKVDVVHSYRYEDIERLMYNNTIQKRDMEQVKELTSYFKDIQEDPGIETSHIRLYMVLPHLYYQNYFHNPIHITRSILMEVAKINGLATYQKCMR